MKKLSARYSLTWVGFLGTVTVYFCRLNLSIAIVAMVNQKSATISGTNVTICPKYGSNNSDDENALSVRDVDIDETSADFDWTPGQQGNLLAGYYYGYVCTQVAAPMVATKIGYKKVWGITMVCAAILTLVTPTMAWLV
jgi:ACS family sodium-dependent inorganic phosphate cotransporter-like MFS transporter 5